MKPRTVVIADDDMDLVAALRKRCEAAGLYVRTAFDAYDAINLIDESAPDLICLDVNMPYGNGLSILEMLANNDEFSSTPVIILTGEKNEETIRLCHHLCAYYVEKCADVWPRIEPIVREVLKLEVAAEHDGKSREPGREIRAREIAVAGSDGRSHSEEESVSPTSDPIRSHSENPISPLRGAGMTNRESEATVSRSRRNLVEVVFEMLGTDPEFLSGNASVNGQAAEPPWVLCIDDDADFSHALKLRLERHGVAVVRAYEGMEGVRYAFTKPADIILLDFEMPNGQGDYVLRRLKDNPVTRDIPVIMVTGKKDRMLERRVLNMGAVKFMNKPLDFDKLLCELRNHIEILPLPVFT